MRVSIKNSGTGHYPLDLFHSQTTNGEAVISNTIQVLTLRDFIKYVTEEAFGRLRSENISREGNLREENMESCNQ